MSGPSFGAVVVAALFRHWSNERRYPMPDTNGGSALEQDTPTTPIVPTKDDANTDD